MFDEWFLWIFIVLIIVLLILLSRRVPKRCDECTYFYGNRCDRCYKDNDSGDRL